MSVVLRAIRTTSSLLGSDGIGDMGRALLATPGLALSMPAPGPT
ncbi:MULTISPECIES: hypothetical protein [unclassified Streptomyces]|nr:hypothetical protein [Streptomyces sp. NBC_00589]WTI39489.1 hypothetical protein OIC96_33240 [Streptomyces sp. NBC_00775]WUB26832.1 hypothetical protein OHA51_16490 [Streptomyces sp. NBC_00589]